MPIKETAAPDKSVDVFKDWASKHKPGRPRKRPQPYEETIPHKVFHANLNDIASGKGFENAQLVAWRHLHTDSKGNHAIVEIRVGENEDDHFLQSAHFGPVAVHHQSLLAELKTLEELKSEHFELAYLRLFALKINAIWLRAAKREDDYFRPIAPCFYGLVAGQLYSSNDFLKITQEAAQKFYAKAASHNAEDLKGG
jgi:hypothetical protein